MGITTGVANRPGGAKIGIDIYKVGKMTAGLSKIGLVLGFSKGEVEVSTMKEAELLE